MERQGKKILGLLRSQAGFTITELMAVVALSGFLMAIAAIGFSTFFVKFEDLSKKGELQRDAFNCLQTMKSGIKIGTGMNMKFSGIATADSVVFVGLGNWSDEIILYPPRTNIEHVNDYVRIYWDRKYVRYQYLDANIGPPPGYIFPQPTHDNKTTVTDLRFYQANTNEPVAKVLTVELTAKTEVREGQFEYVSYKTKMAISLK
jgi:prepilin-type N-terminal cleavage/methylation domain-containing protein